MEALKLLAHPITEFFSAHLIKMGSIACVLLFTIPSSFYVAIKAHWPRREFACGQLELHGGNGEPLPVHEIRL